MYMMQKPGKLIFWAIVIVVGIVAVRNIFLKNDYVPEPRPYAAGNYGMALGSAYDERQATVTAMPQDATYDKSVAGEEPAVYVGAANTGAASQERMIVKTGSLSLVVKDVRSSVDTIAAYAKANGGFVVSSNISKTDVAPYGVVTIRIPVATFDNGFKEIKALGDVENEYTQGSDITEEYTDNAARLKTLQATEQQFLLIMRQAVKITDILAVQNQLTQVQSQIEVLQGRMKYLKESAALSTLTVNLATDPSALPVIEGGRDAWKPVGVLKDAVRSLKNTFQQVGSGIIWVIVFVPLILVALLLVWLVRKIWSAIEKRRHTPLQ